MIRMKNLLLLTKVEQIIYIDEIFQPMRSSTKRRLISSLSIDAVDKSPYGSNTKGLHMMKWSLEMSIVSN